MTEELPLEYKIGDLLRRKGWRLALAESCTGGLVSHRVTNVPGSSDYYLGGVLSYSNQVKEQLLGVQPQTLQMHGAVSEETAREMARGVRKSLGTEVGMSVTGIAGPGGAQPGKPVGLVWIGLSAPDGEWAWKYLWQGSREENKAFSAQEALRRLAAYLEEEFSGGVQVTARFDRDGLAHPEEFAWNGRRWVVESTGRRWEDEAGQHILCMASGGSVFELVYDPGSGLWHIGFHNEDRTAIV